jgi:hypothetical protein
VKNKVKKNQNLIKKAPRQSNLFNSSTGDASNFELAGPTGTTREESSWPKPEAHQARHPATSDVMMLLVPEGVGIKNKILPNIFKQNVKAKFKLRPFNEIVSDTGGIQYFPA